MNGELVRGTDEDREFLMRSAAGRFGGPMKLRDNPCYLRTMQPASIDEQILETDGGSLDSGMIC